MTVVVCGEIQVVFGAVGISTSKIKLRGGISPLLPLLYTCLLGVLEEIPIWCKWNQWICMREGFAKPSYDFLSVDRNQGQFHRVK